jgi:hypothetical protein
MGTQTPIYSTGDHQPRSLYGTFVLDPTTQLDQACLNELVTPRVGRLTFRLLVDVNHNHLARGGEDMQRTCSPLESLVEMAIL